MRIIDGFILGMGYVAVFSAILAVLCAVGMAVRSLYLAFTEWGET